MVRTQRSDSMPPQTDTTRVAHARVEDANSYVVLDAGFYIIRLPLAALPDELQQQEILLRMVACSEMQWHAMKRLEEVVHKTACCPIPVRSHFRPSSPRTRKGGGSMPQ